MRYVRVTILHRPDAGQQSSSHFSFPELLGHSDMVTAREFAFRALGEGDFRKGFVTVVFPHVAPYAFRFERAGLAGHTLVETQGQPGAARLVEQSCG
jgi:hypothetical protein